MLKIDFLLTAMELALMEKVAILEPWLDDVCSRARKCDGRWKVRFDMDELFDCLTALEEQITFPGEPNVRELCALAQRLNTYLKMNGFVHGKTPYSESWARN